MLDHLGIQCADMAASAAFYDAVIGAVGGARLRDPSYYGAFVRDPDGNNVEAVCHAPE